MNEMKRKIAIWCLTVAATVAIAGEAQDTPAAETAPSSAQIVRALMEESGFTYKEESEGKRTEFTYHLSMDENSVEEYRCTAAVEEGDFYASCWAVLPLTIPEDRLDAVAEALASWNGEQACGRFGLDFAKRAAYFVADIPVESLARKEPLLTLTFFGMPVYYIAGKDAAIRAIARGETPSEESNPSPAENAVAENPPDAGIDDAGTDDADDGADMASAAAANDANADAGAAATDAADGEPEPDGDYEIDIPTCDLVLHWIRARGEEPLLPPSPPGETTFQFNAALESETGIFTEATVQIAVLENWVYAIVSPHVRVPESARRKMSRTLVEQSGKDDGITFIWLPQGRIAARAAVPASLVDESPDRTISGLTNRAGSALNRRSRELLAAFGDVQPDMGEARASR